MPRIGDTRRGSEVGYKDNDIKVWSACKHCGKERWVQGVGGKARWEYCRACAQIYNRYSPSGSSHYNWKGGITKQKGGYLLQMINRESPYWDMVKTRSKQVLQHRLVMAEYLGRCLKGNEVVHHLNGVRDDNRIENLTLVTLKNHPHATLNSALKERIRELEGYIDK